MTKGHVRQSIDDLPNEILVQILSYTNNLQTLDALLKAYPRAFRLFPSIAGEVLESVLESSCAIQVVRLIRIVALVQSCPRLAELEPTLDDFLQRYINKTQEAEIGQPDGPSLTKTMHDHSHDLSNKGATLVRGLFVTARRVAWLADAAVDYFRKNLVAAEPQHTVNRYAHYIVEPYHWRRRFEGRSYKLHFGPLRWSEQQRLHRALWRLEHVGQLQRGVLGRNSGWALDDYERLLSVDIWLLGVLFSRWESHNDELLSMAAFIDQCYPDLTSWLLPPPKRSFHGLQNGGDTFCWPTREIDETRSLIPNGLERESDGSRTLRHLTMLPFSPIRIVPTQYYHHHGIPFWYMSTLQDLQLCRSPAWTETSVGDEHFTWRSLLSEDQISTLERILNGLPSVHLNNVVQF